jgi:cell division protease FtsH
LLIEKAYACAKQILTDNYENVETLAKLLLEREVIFTEDVKRILGPRPFATEDEPTESETAVNTSENASETVSEPDAKSDDEATVSTNPEE